MSRVVFGSANHWTSPYQVGSHAWARLFARHGWETAYISDPITPWHVLAGGDRERLRERWALWKEGGRRMEDGRLRAWVPASLLAPHSSSPLRSEWVLKHWHQLAFPPVRNHLRRWGFDGPDLLWLDSVRHAFWGRQIRPRRTVLRMADWTAGFAATPPSVIELEKRLIRESDLVITSARSLEERVKSLRGTGPICTIRNGVDAAFWMEPVAEPPEYRTIPLPRVVYVGAFDDWFDAELLRELARRLEKISFVMIGHRRPGFGPGLDLPNVHWLGSRPREQARAYVQHAQVGIIPFRRNDLIECVCPLKLYEYLACGLPVVATRWTELEHMKTPSRLAAGTEEWTACLRESLDEAGGSSAEESRRAAQSFARANDWGQRWSEWISMGRMSGPGKF